MTIIGGRKKAEDEQILIKMNNSKRNYWDFVPFITLFFSPVAVISGNCIISISIGEGNTSLTNFSENLLPYGLRSGGVHKTREEDERA